MERHQFDDLVTLCYGQALMLPRPRTTSTIISRRLHVPPDLVLVNGQALEPDRPARVDLVRADAHLRAKAVAHPVRHPRAGVPVHASAVDAAHEALGQMLAARQYHVRMVGSVCVDVRNGHLERVRRAWLRGHGLDGQDQIEEFRVEVVVGRFLQQGG